MVANICCICGYIKDENIILFNFPENELVRNIWHKALNFNRSFHKVNKICSKHFADNDILDYTACGGIKYLKEGAIPLSNYSKNIKDSETTLTVDNIKSKHIVDSDIVENYESNEIGLKTNVISLAADDDIKQFHNYCKNPNPNDNESTTDSASSNSDLNTNDFQTNINHLWNFSGNISDVDVTPTNNSYKLVRYVGDIGSPDISTPSKARIAIDICKRSLVEKNRKLKNAIYREQCLIKKVTHLKQLISELRKKKNTI